MADHQSDDASANYADGSSVAVAKPKAEARSKPRKLPPYNVILLDDDDHTHEYVIEMLQSLFGFPPHKGFDLARTVDAEGRAILLTTTKEHAEFKRDQIHAYGADVRVATCQGSMSACIEPADA